MKNLITILILSFFTFSFSEESIEVKETITYFEETFKIVDCPSNTTWGISPVEVCVEKVFRKDGTLLWEKTWTRSYRHGKWTKYYSSGEKWYEGLYQYGFKVGNWTEWYESGKVKNIENFKEPKNLTHPLKEFDYLY